MSTKLENGLGMTCSVFGALYAQLFTVCPTLLCLILYIDNDQIFLPEPSEMSRVVYWGNV